MNCAPTRRSSLRTSRADPRADAGHLVVVDLTAGYGSMPVIHGVCMSVAAAEVVAVVGPNGAGKSTLMKAITGAVRPMTGAVELGGQPLAGLRADQIARCGVGYVPQVRDVFDSLTVKENLRMGGYTLPRRTVTERIGEVVEAFPVLGGMLGRTTANLSGGERKMVAIGRVLMTRPTLVILDEPTAGLAPKLAETLLGEYVGRVARSGVAVLLVEQRTHDALEAADYAYVMASGAVKLATPAADLLARGDLGEMFLGGAVD